MSGKEARMDSFSKSTTVDGVDAVVTSRAVAAAVCFSDGGEGGGGGVKRDEGREPCRTASISM